MAVNRTSEQYVPTADSASNVTTSDAVGNKNDTIAGDSIHAKLLTIMTVGLAAATTIVERGAAVLPASTQTPYFTVTGRVIITQLVGEVTTIFDGTVNSIKLIITPTVGAPVDLCAALVVTSDAAGTMYNLGGIGDPLVESTSGGMDGQPGTIIVADGTIDLDATATDATGSTKWTIHYIPLDEMSMIEAA